MRNETGVPTKVLFEEHQRYCVKIKSEFCKGHPFDLFDLTEMKKTLETLENNDTKR